MASSMARGDSAKEIHGLHTHLCFADDLLIFTDGSLASVQGVLQVLRDFEALSGLSISIEKSNIFPSGLTAAETEAINTASGIPIGSLPIRYLGLPLNSKKLNMTNCEPMLRNAFKLLTRCVMPSSGKARSRVNILRE